MSATTTRPPYRALGAALRQIGRRLTHIGHHLTAQAALGALLAGNHTTAREVLETLPPSYLDHIAGAAGKLADLARHAASLHDRT